MIPIPESAVVTRSKAAERLLAEKARAWIEGDERSPGLHASHLLDPMQSYWQIVDPRPLPDRLVTMFLVGKVLHAFVLGSVAGKVALEYTDAWSVVSDELGVSHSPDAVIDGMVRELKTSRSYHPAESVEDLGIYLEQLLVYMAATKTTKAQVWVLYLNIKDESGRTSPGFRGYDFVISEADLAKTTEYLVGTRMLLEQALVVKNTAKLPLCRDWKCGAKNCDWYNQCKPAGRFGDPIFDNVVKPKKSKV